MAIQETAEKRIKAAMLALMEQKPFEKVRVSDIIKIAGVNRSTFYLYFANTNDLLEEIIHDITDSVAFRNATPVTDARQLEEYAEQMYSVAESRKDEVLTIIRSTGDPIVSYRIGSAVRDRLRQARDECRLEGEAVRLCVEMSATSITQFLSPETVLGESGLKMTYADYEYDPEVSYITNLGRFLTEEKGGRFDTQYDMVCAGILMATKGYSREMNVTQLLEAAGISRTEFYRYYKNITDFEHSVEFTCIEVIASWGAKILGDKKLLDKRHLDIMVSGETVKKSVDIFFRYGGIGRIAAQIFSNFLNILGDRRGRPLSRREGMAATYYFVILAQAISGYMLGRIEYSAVEKNLVYYDKIIGLIK